MTYVLHNHCQSLDSHIIFFNKSHHIAGQCSTYLFVHEGESTCQSWSYKGQGHIKITKHVSYVLSVVLSSYFLTNYLTIKCYHLENIFCKEKKISSLAIAKQLSLLTTHHLVSSYSKFLSNEGVMDWTRYLLHFIYGVWPWI